MGLGALAVLVTGQIDPATALRAINLDVLIFLFGMFVVGQAMEESGFLADLSYRVFRHAHSLDALVGLILLVMGLLSAVLMNDTVAIIGTPVVLAISRTTRVPPRPLLLSLAFAVTIGSVASPIGNPQNLLVAIHGGIANPFVTFGRYLLVPTLLCLGAAFVVLRLAYRRLFDGAVLEHDGTRISDPALARLCRWSLIVLGVMLAAKVGLVLAGVQLDFRLTYIAIAAALPVLLFSRRRVEIVRRIDWTTLVFFAAMFVLMESVWRAGVIQGWIAEARLDPASPGVIMLLSVALSQVLSNVPLTALYLPLLGELHAATGAYMALAAGATIAGALTILGAASNVIIIQNAERRHRETIGFVEFVRVGAPLTVVCAGIYYLFLVI
jgi:Na+/H+ antiporter NhaD/arsenite permease-like protein